MTKKQLWESKLAQRGKHLKEAYDDFASAIMSDGTKVYASASTRSTRTYNYEDVEFEFGAKKGRGTYRWMNRPWQRFDFADALKHAMIDAGVDKEFARECIDKSGSLRSAVEYFAKNHKSEKKEIEESYSKQELLDAVMDSFGFTEDEALEYIKKASDKTKQELVKGFRQDAKKNFNEGVDDNNELKEAGSELEKKPLLRDGFIILRDDEDEFFHKYGFYPFEEPEKEESKQFFKEHPDYRKDHNEDEPEEDEDDDKVYQIKYWLTEEDREEGFSDIFIDSFDSKQEAIMKAKKMVDRGDVASVEVFDAEDATEQPVYFYDGNEENNDSLKEEKNNDKGAKIASIIASALNKQGGHGPMGNEEVVADENTITLVSQAGLETYKFNNDGSVDNLSIDDMIKTMLEDGDIEESEIEDIREEYSHFNSIKDLLQSNLTWFMELPEKLIIKKVEEILDEEKDLEESKQLNEMVIDLILDRKEGMPYSPADFYGDCMQYSSTFNGIADAITRAMDEGTEEDVKKAICDYIRANDYNEKICDFVNSVQWLEESLKEARGAGKGQKLDRFFRLVGNLHKDNLSKEEIAKLEKAKAEVERFEPTSEYEKKDKKNLLQQIERVLKDGKLEEAIDLDKHVWEGWTVQDFIDELEPLFDQIMNGHSWQKPFKDKAELKAWCIDNQPYYKKYIPGVVEYFFKKMKKNENLNEKLVAYDSKRWKPEDIELHKSINWKERNYEDFAVSEDSFETEVVAYELKGGPQRKTVKVVKHLRANPIYPPYYRATQQPFKNVVGPMYDGHKHGKYDIHDRYETQEVYDILSN